MNDDDFVPDPDAAAKVLCAYTGDWGWETINDKAKDRYRFQASQIIDAHNDQEAVMYMPLFYDCGIGLDYGGAALKEANIR